MVAFASDEQSDFLPCLGFQFIPWNFRSCWCTLYYRLHSYIQNLEKYQSSSTADYTKNTAHINSKLTEEHSSSNAIRYLGAAFAFMEPNPVLLRTKLPPV